MICLSSSNKIQTATITLNSDKWNSGDLSNDIPVTNWFMNMLGRKTVTKKARAVVTDYAEFIIAYRCNDDNWVESHDEYYLLVNNGARGQAILNGIIERQNNSTQSLQMATLLRINQANPLCNTIKFD